MCAWYRKAEVDSRGKHRHHCGLASEAPPKPEKTRKPKRDRSAQRNERKNRMNKNKGKK